jgi:hypothetical protein
MGDGFTCALLPEDTNSNNLRIKCWGKGGSWLGYGDRSTRGDGGGEMGDALPFVDLGALNNADSAGLTCGADFVCSWGSSVGVKCWGENDSGQLGTGGTNSRGGSPGTMGDALPFVGLPPASSYLAVTAGRSHACAVIQRQEDSVTAMYCWWVPPPPPAYLPTAICLRVEYVSSE